ncbi:hypothetical protein H072_5140 [Dactylellina haptotyla CBS 200.50]|uniref:type II protein arginine methyltransferase n=1 Tax=Dactylellina haptotyla (strain CBS 200.50) TaxID=1284197 RepID=S8ADI2_DACHA|nr:hypothetical protein H072_5140 [Dactylellina haptotyla CBS 200.50]
MPRMEAKDIKIHGANLDKAVRDKLPADHIAGILGRLKSEVVATEQVLRETKIGMIVNKLRGHSDKAVSELAKDIVNKWKKDVSIKPKSGSSGDAKGGVAMKKESSTNGTSGRDTPNKSTPTPTAARKGSSSVDPMKRTHKTDGVNCDVYGDDVRSKSLGMIYDGMVVGSDATPDEVFKLAKETEQCLYTNHSKRTDGPYRAKLRSLFFNLKDPKNPNLRKNVLSGRIEPVRLAMMSSEEMASAERKREDEKIEEENMKEAMVAKAPTSVTDQLRCGKCGKRNVSYSQAQTRSADEPMTTNTGSHSTAPSRTRARARISSHAPSEPMDSSQALLSSLFRQLFRHPACQRRTTATVARQYHSTPHQQASPRRRLAAYHPPRRRLHTSAVCRVSTDETGWLPRDKLPTEDLAEEFNRYPLVTAAALAKRRERPKMVKMLVRDYIDDSLYNPHYGYFSKEAVIFNTEKPFVFPRIKNEIAFHQDFALQYKEFEDKLDAESPNELRQLWHTPTELFRPYYGEALARYLYENYVIDLYPEYDLVVYEMGAGNGTLMVNILDWLRTNVPDVYVRTQFKIVEISKRMVEQQLKSVERSGHSDHVEVINSSVFDYKTFVANPCFFLALEVFDNFAHDMIRYDLETQQPLQGYLLIDREGDFHEFYTPELEPRTRRYLELRRRIDNPKHDKLFSNVIGKSFSETVRNSSSWNKFKTGLKSRMWFSENLTAPEFIPTKAMEFLEQLNGMFPHHRLLMSDFDYLPEAIEGVNAPVVQTRYRREMIAVKQLFVHQGYFDILFPTDFMELAKMYELLSGKFARIETHEKFMRSWAELGDTTTKSKENPLLTWYKNASVMHTH